MVVYMTGYNNLHKNALPVTVSRYTFVMYLTALTMHVPEFGSDKDILSFAYSFIEALLQGSSNLILVVVSMSAVDVAVARLQSCFHCRSHLSWFGQPSAASRDSREQPQIDTWTVNIITLST